MATPFENEFPKQLSYNRFVAIQHRFFVPMMFFLNTVCFGKCTEITFIDSTKISVCHNKRIRRNNVFAGFAKTGKNTMGWFYGFKLHLLCNDKGELLSFCLTPGKVDDRDPKTLKILTQKLFGKLFGDKVCRPFRALIITRIPFHRALPCAEIGKGFALVLRNHRMNYNFAANGLNGTQVTNTIFDTFHIKPYYLM